jgi:transposase
VNVIGVDVAKGKSQCVLVTNNNVDRYFEIKHNRPGFFNLYTISKESEALIVFETTGVYSAQLTRFCIQENLDFIEVNPLEASIKMAELRRDKTDRSDAEKLAFLIINQHDLLVGRRP